jgi:hypothetical protein
MFLRNIINLFNIKWLVIGYECFRPGLTNGDIAPFRLFLDRASPISALDASSGEDTCSLRRGLRKHLILAINLLSASLLAFLSGLHLSYRNYNIILMEGPRFCLAKPTNQEIVGEFIGLNV